MLKKKLSLKSESSTRPGEVNQNVRRLVAREGVYISDLSYIFEDFIENADDYAYSLMDKVAEGEITKAEEVAADKLMNSIVDKLESADKDLRKFLALIKKNPNLNV
jgi:hypothetical protein